MTLTTTIIERTVFGNKKVVMGYTTNDSTGGTVVTGLKRVEGFVCTPHGSSVKELAVNETFPRDSGSIIVVTESSVAFSWIAFGI